MILAKVKKSFLDYKKDETILISNQWYRFWKSKLELLKIIPDKVEDVVSHKYGN